MVEYKQLEPSSFRTLGIPDDKVPTFNGSDVSFYATSSFIYTLFFISIVGAAFYQYILVGVYRMEASENGIRKSNETFRRTTWGLLGVFGLFLIIFTLNKDILTGNVGLDALRANPVTNQSQTSGSITAITSGVTTSGSGGSSASCDTKENTITKLQSAGGICGGAVCTILSGCNYSAYSSIIDQNVGSDVQLKKMVIVTLCKESRGNVNAQNNNPNGTFDCGLMQINQPLPCGSAILDPAENIRQGVVKMKQKIASTNQTYQNIPAVTGPFSSYNCCANGTVPNAPSADCTTANGFPFSIPKWACPINPGEGKFNMCTVKNYACELSACMNQL
jgi:hypothetical protein